MFWKKKCFCLSCCLSSGLFFFTLLSRMFVFLSASGGNDWARQGPVLLLLLSKLSIESGCFRSFSCKGSARADVVKIVVKYLNCLFVIPVQLINFFLFGRYQEEVPWHFELSRTNKLYKLGLENKALFHVLSKSVLKAITRQAWGRSYLSHSVYIVWKTCLSQNLRLTKLMFDKLTIHVNELCTFTFSIFICVFVEFWLLALTAIEFLFCLFWMFYESLLII